MTEPVIQINGHILTVGQAMAVRVAVTNFHAETASIETKKALGPIADAYHQRLGEALKLMFKPHI